MRKSVEELLVYWLPAQLPGVQAATTRPGDLTAQVPFIQVTRVGGGRASKSTVAKPSVDLDVYVPASRTAPGMGQLAALNLAQQVEDLCVWRLPTMILGHVLALEGVFSGPARRNYENTDVARAGLSLGFSMHDAIA